MQDFDISVDEWAVVFFLIENESGVIGGSNFVWSFHGGDPFSIMFGGWDGGGVFEIDFAAENGKMCSIGSGGLEWQDGTVLR